MEKKFEMKEDFMEVVVTQSDKIYLPTEEGQKIIGTYEQTTIQKIDKDKAQLLADFITSENEKAEKQLGLIDKELEGITVEEIDSLVVDACKKQIGKGTKVFKQKMLVLNNHLEQITKRKNLSQQKEYVETQLTQMRKELADITKELS